MEFKYVAAKKYLECSSIIVNKHACVMFKGSFTLIVCTVRLATSSFVMLIPNNVLAAPSINNY